jgi:hypothetical protein
VTLTDFSLSMTGSILPTKTKFKLTTVYGPKLSFLEDIIRETKPFKGELWLCIGDVNLIYEARDKNNQNLNP